MLQSIPFFERLWVRELGSNSIFITILTLINVVYGDVLNDKDVERLKGVYSVVPESLKKEMAFNLLANGDKIKEIIENNKNSQVKPSDIFSGSTEWVDDSLAEERYSICQACPELIKLTTTCKKCGCFMVAKTKLQGAACPIGKW